LNYNIGNNLFVLGIDWAIKHIFIAEIHTPNLRLLSLLSMFVYN